MAPSPTPRGVVVTGASRGIGAALARRLAGRRGAALLLCGRDETGLAAAAAACREAGAVHVEFAVVDVRDRDAMRTALRDFDARHPVGLCVANAGVALPARTAAENESATYGEIDINLAGAMNTVLPLLEPMTARGAGQVAFTSSLAAFAPLPDSPAYSATKAALLVYGLALRERLRPAGIRVCVICPGYVETDMGRRYRGWRPLLMNADEAAGRIVRGLDHNAPVIAFPASLALVAKLSTFVPEGVRRLGLGGFRFKIDRS